MNWVVLLVRSFQAFSSTLTPPAPLLPLFLDYLPNLISQNMLGTLHLVSYEHMKLPLNSFQFEHALPSMKELWGNQPIQYFKIYVPLHK